MPKVTFIAHDGTETTIDAQPGLPAMTVAVHNGVTGILGDCGGACSCCTCHVYVPADWQAAVGPAGIEESELLSMRDDANATSRLSCQIVLNDALDGLVLHMPEEQY